MKAKRYIRGRHNIACCVLIDELKAVGVDASVGHRGGKLIVVVRSQEDARAVPAIWHDYETKVEVARTGEP